MYNGKNSGIKMVPQNINIHPAAVFIKFFQGKITYSSGWSPTPYVAGYVLELLIYLPPPLKCWDDECVPLHQVCVGNQTQGLINARQALSKLSYSPSPSSIMNKPFLRMLVHRVRNTKGMCAAKCLWCFINHPSSIPISCHHYQC